MFEREKSFKYLEREFFTTFEDLRDKLPPGSRERKDVAEVIENIRSGRLVVVPVDRNSVVQPRILSCVEARVVRKPHEPPGAMPVVFPAILLDIEQFLTRDPDVRVADLALMTSVALSLPGLGKGYERRLKDVYEGAFGFRRKCMWMIGVLPEKDPSEKDLSGDLSLNKLRELEMKAFLGDWYYAGVGIEDWNMALEKFLDTRYQRIAEELINNVGTFCLVRELYGEDVFLELCELLGKKFWERSLEEKYRIVGEVLAIRTVWDIASSPRNN